MAINREISKKWTFFAIIIEVLLIASCAFLFCFWQNKTAKVETAQSKEPEKIEEPRNLVALGDSLTQAANLSAGMIGDNPDFSFATGTKIDSFYLQATKVGEKLTPHNLAVSGAETADILESQVPKSLELNPKFITLIAGGNDFMAGVSTEKFTNNLVEIVTRSQQNGAIILIAGNPDLASLSAATYPSCSRNGVTPALKAAAQERAKEYNDAIQGIASQYNLIYIDLFNVLSTDDLSPYDCLHFSQKGQQTVANAFFREFTKQ